MVKYYPSGKLSCHTKNGSFQWRDILKLLNSFKGMALVVIRNGQSCFFLEDLWGGRVLKLDFPELFSFARNKLLTLGIAKNLKSQQLFHLPLSVEAFQQYNLLRNILDSLDLSEDHDVWRYIWNSYEFTSRKAYRALMGHSSIHLAYSWLWKSSCQHKHKVLLAPTER